MCLMDSNDGFIGPVNLGNPREFSILELARKVLEQTGSKSELVFNALPQDDPRQRRPDAALAQQKLNWQATTPLDEGLSRTIADFRARLGKQ
jgi:UDP-glucuronate decarboxylase